MADAKVKAVRLTPNMIELLTDLVTNPQMYVRTFGKWGRTAEALRDRKLATLHWCEGNQTKVVVTQTGRDEAARRGLTNTGS
jgi:hypothetical protein